MYSITVKTKNMLLRSDVIKFIKCLLANTINYISEASLSSNIAGEITD